MEADPWLSESVGERLLWSNPLHLNCSFNIKFDGHSPQFGSAPCFPSHARLNTCGCGLALYLYILNSSLNLNYTHRATEVLRQYICIWDIGPLWCALQPGVRWTHFSSPSKYLWGQLKHRLSTKAKTKCSSLTTWALLWILRVLPMSVWGLWTRPGSDPAVTPTTAGIDSSTPWLWPQIYRRIIDDDQWMSWWIDGVIAQYNDIIYTPNEKHKHLSSAGSVGE